MPTSGSRSDSSSRKSEKSREEKRQGSADKVTTGGGNAVKTKTGLTASRKR